MLARHDIFISYSRQDADTVAPLVEELRQRGYNVFFDTRSIVAGDPWKRRLASAVRDARVCILCWSKHARDSEYVAFEYARAEALGRPVLPWLLDGTPLPAMLEIQGVVEPDPVRAAGLFLPRLGWRLRTRRFMQGGALLLLLLAATLIEWRAHRPPPPWEFEGRVTDSVTNLPVSGVTVEIEAGNREFTTATGGDGRYAIRLPQPKPEYLRLVFSKQGYRGEAPVAVSPNHTFNTDMVPLH